MSSEMAGELKILSRQRRRKSIIDVLCLTWCHSIYHHECLLVKVAHRHVTHIHSLRHAPYQGYEPALVQPGTSHPHHNRDLQCERSFPLKSDEEMVQEVALCMEYGIFLSGFSVHLFYAVDCQ